MVLVPRRPKSITKFILLIILLFLILYDLTSNTSLSPYEDVLEYDELEDEWELNQANVPKLSVILGNSTQRKKSRCANFPDLYNVEFNNIYWQVQRTRKETYYLYSAYLDTRGSSIHHPHYPLDYAFVRILGMSDVTRLNVETSSLRFCQFWFETKSKPVLTRIIDIKLIWIYWWGRQAHYFPYLISCKLPSTITEIPVSVSLATTHCSNSTANLKIAHRDQIFAPTIRNDTKPTFAVCVKPLDFPDPKMLPRLIEWIETLRLLGAHKIIFYEYFVDSKIKDVLDYYEADGFIDVVQITLPGSLPNQAQMRHLFVHSKTMEKRLTELLPYNDCFYRNIYDYDYIAIMDTDEIILPKREENWSDLLTTVKNVDIGRKRLKGKPFTTFCFENFYFLNGMMASKENEVSDIPEGFHMLRHIYRSRTSTKKRYMKCFHSAKTTLGVHNHFAFFCRDGRNCTRYYVNPNRGQMNHYRSTCVPEIRNCSSYILDSVKDTGLWRIKEDIISRATNLLNMVG